MGILFTHTKKKFHDKIIISLTVKLRMYILGTVRMSLLHVIMMIRMTLQGVPNRKETTATGNSYGLTVL